MSQGSWGDGGGFRGMMGRQPKMGAMLEGRLAYLKGELNVTVNQPRAWDNICGNGCGTRRAVRVPDRALGVLSHIVVRIDKSAAWADLVS